MPKKCTLNIIREELEKPLTLKEFEEVLEEITRDLTNRLVILELRQLGDEFGVLTSFYATSIATTLIATGGAAKIPQEMVFEKGLYTGTLLTNIDLRENPEYLMQCTGLKDREGNLIFEGDILEVNYAAMDEYVARQVKWDDERLCFYMEDNWNEHRLQLTPTYYEKKCIWDLGLPCLPFTLKIIGNIYEHSELLEVK